MKKKIKPFKKREKQSFNKESSDKRYDNGFVQSEANDLVAAVAELLDQPLNDIIKQQLEGQGLILLPEEEEVLSTIAKKIPLSLQVEVLGKITEAYANYLYIKKK